MRTDEEDRLEAPSLAVRPLAWIAIGALAFIAIAILGLSVFYRGFVGQRPPPSLRTFPAPRLETSIDPRTVPASGPGPASPALPPVTRFDPPTLARAMQIVAARGAHAYDPPGDAR
jgi:hypothetical protein